MKGANDQCPIVALVQDGKFSLGFFLGKEKNWCLQECELQVPHETPDITMATRREDWFTSTGVINDQIFFCYGLGRIITWSCLLNLKILMAKSTSMAFCRGTKKRIWTIGKKRTQGSQKINLHWSNLLCETAINAFDTEYKAFCAPSFLEDY